MEKAEEGEGKKKRALCNSCFLESEALAVGSRFVGSPAAMVVGVAVVAAAPGIVREARPGLMERDTIAVSSPLGSVDDPGDCFRCGDSLLDGCVVGSTLPAVLFMTETADGAQPIAIR